jgi:flagellar motor switch protein FliN/FliY
LRPDHATPDTTSDFISDLALPSLDKIGLDITVVLGTAKMPIHKLLRMGRGAIIELSAHDDDQVEILANDFPIARGQIVVNGTRIAVEITELLVKAALPPTETPHEPEPEPQPEPATEAA